MMRSIKELIAKNREYITKDGNIVFPAKAASEAGCSSSAPAKSRKRVHLLALGDVGGTVLLGLKLEGGDILDEIGIYDLDPRVLRRYEREMNQICFPDGRQLPQVMIWRKTSCLTAICSCSVHGGVPPVGATGDVRMAQFEANRGLGGLYAKAAVSAGFGGIFAVVSDPVDPLCRRQSLAGLPQDRSAGIRYGCHERQSAVFCDKGRAVQQYLTEGRAFGPHGEDLVIADSLSHYDDSCSRALTERTVKSIWTPVQTDLSHISHLRFLPGALPAGDAAGRLELFVCLSGQRREERFFWAAETAGRWPGRDTAGRSAASKRNCFDGSKTPSKIFAE